MNFSLTFLLTSLIFLLTIYLVTFTKFYNYYDYKKEVDFFSSVFCKQNTNLLNQKCKFKNLCYFVEKNEFFFINHQNKSIIYNLPENRFKPSLQFLNSFDHNKYYFNFVDVDYLDLKNLFKNYKFFFVENLSFLFSRFKPDNLMHSLHDDILPLYHTIKLSNFEKKEPNFENINFFFYDDYSRIEENFYMNEFYQIIFNKVNFIYKKDLKKTHIICFREVEIGLEKDTVWYDYGFKEYQKPVDKSLSEKKLIQVYSNEIKEIILSISKSSLIQDCSEYFIIMIKRSKSRLILNEEKLDFLLKKAFNYKIFTFDLDKNLSLQFLVKMLSCTKILIGMHGAGLVLSFFLPKNSIVIELFPYKINSNHYKPYEQLASIKDLNYYSWTNIYKQNSFFNLDYFSASIVNKINEDLEVNQSLCCDEPYFLFRIYQDTKVDEKEIKNLLLNIKNNKNKFYNTYTVAPSKIKIENCTRLEFGFEIFFSTFWNMKVEENFSYEILISYNNDRHEHYKNIKTTKIKLLLTEPIYTKKNYIWVRANVNEVIGPFNDQPYEC